MSEWKIKKGNTVIQDIPIYDEDGDLITTLAAATEGKFQIKEQEAGAVILEKTIGAGIDIDTPVVGWIRLTLTAVDTDALEIKYYYMAIQFKWGLEVREVWIKIDDIITEKLNVVQDIVTS